MRKPKVIKRKLNSFVNDIKKYFMRLGVKWKRMRKKQRIMITSVTVAAAAAAVLLIVFLPGMINKSMREETPGATVQETAPAATAEPLPTSTPTPVPTPTPDPTLSLGMEKPEVNKLQNRLMDLGYLDIDETTNLYGPATNYAVQLFQRQHGLEMDGICGPITLAAVYSEDAKPYTLLEGTEGNDVDMLQERLKELGYLSKATGYYGTETIDAVMAFQERNDIGVDGKTGQVTLDLIYSADAMPSPEMEQRERRKGTIGNFLDSLRDQMGKPYVWGAAGPNSFDCSGLVTYCLRQAGSTTGRLNAQGFSDNDRWENIKSMDDMEIGDLIFYSGRGKRVGHVGVYIGDGMMIDASSANGKVVERSCRTSYWESHFVNARRPW